MLFRLHLLLNCICFLYNQFLFSLLHFILCRMCVCHMFNKVLTYLLTYLLAALRLLKPSGLLLRLPHKNELPEYTDESTQLSL